MMRFVADQFRLTTFNLIIYREFSMSKSKSTTPMTSKAVSRIQSSNAKSNGGQVAKGSFTARAQSAAAKSSSKK